MGYRELNMQVNTTSILLLTSTFLLGAFFLFLYRLKRQEYLLAWSAAWLLLSAHFFAQVLGWQLMGGPWTQWIGECDESLLAMAALTFYCAARLYSGLTIPVRSMVAATAAGVMWSVAHAHNWVDVPVILGVGLVFMLVGYTFWQEGRKQEAPTDILLAITFVGWGALYLVSMFPALLNLAGDANLSSLMVLPELFTCVLMVMAVYEEERRRVERNMLALSSLNLATSSFVGGEIQKTLAQALDRVLNVVRIPAGALCLQHGEAAGPTSVIVTGLGDSFYSAVQDSNLDGYFVNLVARLGGLVVLRNLSSDSEYKGLEKEEAFLQLRQLLLGQSLRTVVGISLQTKERIFGFLLLGTPDNRSFTPAERRLLLALGQQIGTAVENSYLIQQSARRSEELHILNEIGRALSSTLELDTLLERICTEMRRVLHADSFFIAFHQQKGGEVRFEIEVRRRKADAEAHARDRKSHGGIRRAYRTASSGPRPFSGGNAAAGVRANKASWLALRRTSDSL